MPDTKSAVIEKPSWSARISLTIVPELLPPDPKASIPRSPEGGVGVYRVTIVLAQPGKQAFQAELDFPKLMSSGDSPLLLPPDINSITVTVEGPNKADSMDVTFATNSRKALATAQMCFSARNFAEAEKTASNFVFPILSWWSYRYGVAIDIAGHEVVEENTQVVRYLFGHLGSERILQISSDDVKILSVPEYRQLFASYREAANATNPFYQFLCYYRVTEGVKKLRSQRSQSAIASGKSPHQPSEVIPMTLVEYAFWDDELKPYKGRKFTWALDQLRSVVRNAVAHLDPQNSLAADKFEDVVACEKAIPVIRYIARAMLRTDLVDIYSFSASILSD